MLTLIPPLFCPENVVCFIYVPAAYIQVHFKLDFFMEANTMNIFGYLFGYFKTNIKLNINITIKLYWCVKIGNLLANAQMV